MAPHVTTLAPYMKSFEYRYAHTSSNTHGSPALGVRRVLYQMRLLAPRGRLLAVMVAGLVVLIPAMASP